MIKKSNKTYKDFPSLSIEYSFLLSFRNVFVLFNLPFLRFFGSSVHISSGSWSNWLIFDCVNRSNKMWKKIILHYLHSSEWQIWFDDVCMYQCSWVLHPFKISISLTHLEYIWRVLILGASIWEKVSVFNDHILFVFHCFWIKFMTQYGYSLDFHILKISRFLIQLFLSYWRKYCSDYILNHLP